MKKRALLPLPLPSSLVGGAVLQVLIVALVLLIMVNAVSASHHHGHGRQEKENEKDAEQQRRRMEQERYRHEVLEYYHDPFDQLGQPKTPAAQEADRGELEEVIASRMKMNNAPPFPGERRREGPGPNDGNVDGDGGGTPPLPYPLRTRYGYPLHRFTGDDAVTPEELAQLKEDILRRHDAEMAAEAEEVAAAQQATSTARRPATPSGHSEKDGVVEPAAAFKKEEDTAEPAPSPRSGTSNNGDEGPMPLGAEELHTHPSATQYSPPEGGGDHHATEVPPVHSDTSEHVEEATPLTLDAEGNIVGDGMIDALQFDPAGFIPGAGGDGGFIQPMDGTQPMTFDLTIEPDENGNINIGGDEINARMQEAMSNARAQHALKMMQQQQQLGDHHQNQQQGIQLNLDAMAGTEGTFKMGSTTIHISGNNVGGGGRGGPRGGVAPTEPVRVPYGPQYPPLGEFEEAALRRQAQPGGDDRNSKEGDQQQQQQEEDISSSSSSSSWYDHRVSSPSQYSAEQLKARQEERKRRHVLEVQAAADRRREEDAARARPWSVPAAVQQRFDAEEKHITEQWHKLEEEYTTTTTGSSSSSRVSRGRRPPTGGDDATRPQQREEEVVVVQVLCQHFFGFDQNTVLSAKRTTATSGGGGAVEGKDASSSGGVTDTALRQQLETVADFLSIVMQQTPSDPPPTQGSEGDAALPLRLSVGDIQRFVAHQQWNACLPPSSPPSSSFSSSHQRKEGPPEEEHTHDHHRFLSALQQQDEQEDKGGLHQYQRRAANFFHFVSTGFETGLFSANRETTTKTPPPPPGASSSLLRDPNPALAGVYLRLAANLGSVQALASLAHRHEHGYDTPTNCPRSLHYYVKAAEAVLLKHNVVVDGPLGEDEEGDTPPPPQSSATSTTGRRHRYLNPTMLHRGGRHTIPMPSFAPWKSDGSTVESSDTDGDGSGDTSLGYLTEDVMHYQMYLAEKGSTKLSLFTAHQTLLGHCYMQRSFVEAKKIFEAMLSGGTSSGGGGSGTPPTGEARAYDGAIGLAVLYSNDFFSASGRRVIAHDFNMSLHYFELALNLTVTSDTSSGGLFTSPMDGSMDLDEEEDVLEGRPAALHDASSSSSSSSSDGQREFKPYAAPLRLAPEALNGMGFILYNDLAPMTDTLRQSAGTPTTDTDSSSSSSTDSQEGNTCGSIESAVPGYLMSQALHSELLGRCSAVEAEAADNRLQQHLSKRRVLMAFDYFRLSASGGNPHALYNLAVMYLRGDIDVESDRRRTWLVTTLVGIPGSHELSFFRRRVRQQLAQGSAVPPTAEEVALLLIDQAAQLGHRLASLYLATHSPIAHAVNYGKTARDQRAAGGGDGSDPAASNVCRLSLYYAKRALGNAAVSARRVEQLRYLMQVIDVHREGRKPPEPHTPFDNFFTDEKEAAEPNGKGTSSTTSSGGAGSGGGYFDWLLGVLGSNFNRAVSGFDATGFNRVFGNLPSTAHLLARRGSSSSSSSSSSKTSSSAAEVYQVDPGYMERLESIAFELALPDAVAMVMTPQLGQDDWVDTQIGRRRCIQNLLLLIGDTQRFPGSALHGDDDGDGTDESSSSVPPLPNLSTVPSSGRVTSSLMSPRQKLLYHFALMFSEGDARSIILPGSKRSGPVDSGPALHRGRDKMTSTVALAIRLLGDLYLNLYERVTAAQEEKEEAADDRKQEGSFPQPEGDVADGAASSQEEKEEDYSPSAPPPAAAAADSKANIISRRFSYLRTMAMRLYVRCATQGMDSQCLYNLGYAVESGQVDSLRPFCPNDFTASKGGPMPPLVKAALFSTVRHTIHQHLAVAIPTLMWWVPHVPVGGLQSTLMQLFRYATLSMAAEQAAAHGGGAGGDRSHHHHNPSLDYPVSYEKAQLLVLKLRRTWMDVKLTAEERLLLAMGFYHLAADPLHPTTGLGGVLKMTEGEEAGNHQQQQEKTSGGEEDEQEEGGGEEGEAADAENADVRRDIGHAPGLAAWWRTLLQYINIHLW